MNEVCRALAIATGALRCRPLAGDPQSEAESPKSRGHAASSGTIAADFLLFGSGVHLTPDSADAIREQIDGRSLEEETSQIRQCSDPPVRLWAGKS